MRYCKSSRSVLLRSAPSGLSLIGLTASAWPFEDALVSSMKGENTVIAHHTNGLHWFYLKHACIQSADKTITVLNPTAEDQSLMETLQSLFPASVRVHSSSTDSLSKSTFTASRSPSAWLFVPHADLPSLLPQLGLLHSVVLHPNLFPPVPAMHSAHR